jgi:uncharacterized delta-60 repeat protein
VNRKRLLLVCAALAALGVFAGSLSAAAGDLDPIFGSRGRVITDFGGSESAFAVVRQRDGRVIVAGDRFDPGPSDDFVLARYTARGALDPTFDGDGKVSTDFGGHFDGAFAAALQPDGKIVAAGYGFATTGPQDFALARYNPDGTLDGSFGVGGKLVTSFGNSYDAAFALLIQPDGKIVAAGRTRSTLSYAFAVARYLPNGALDPSFDSDGLVTTQATAAHDHVLDLEFQADGKILAVGTAFDPADSARTTIVLARYLPDGSLDGSFDGDGLVVAPFGTSLSAAVDSALQRDGKLLTAGGYVSRFNPDGSVDTGFGTGGRAYHGVDTTAVVVQSDGKLLVAGDRFTPPSTVDIAVARLTAAGRLDTTYGRGGTVSTDLRSGSEDRAAAAVLGSDGKLVVAGATRPTFGSGPWDFAAARYVAIPFCVVPNVRGQTLRVARIRLARASCRLGKDRRAYSRRVKKGRVISQRPHAGARLADHSKVSLVVSRGRRG